MSLIDLMYRFIEILRNELFGLFLLQEDYDKLFCLSSICFDLKKKIKKIKLINGPFGNIPWLDKRYNLNPKYYSNITELIVELHYATIRIDSLVMLKKLKINYILGELVISNLPNLLELDIKGRPFCGCDLEISNIPNIKIVELQEIRLFYNVQELQEAIICNFNNVNFANSQKNEYNIPHDYSQFKNVKLINFNRCYGFENLNTLKQNTSLEKITLINCNDLQDITGIINVKNIIISCCRNLKHPKNFSSFPNVKFK